MNHNFLRALFLWSMSCRSFWVGVQSRPQVWGNLGKCVLTFKERGTVFWHSSTCPCAWSRQSCILLHALAQGMYVKSFSQPVMFFSFCAQFSPQWRKASAKNLTCSHVYSWVQCPMGCFQDRPWHSRPLLLWEGIGRLPGNLPGMPSEEASCPHGHADCCWHSCSWCGRLHRYHRDNL